MSGKGSRKKRKMQRKGLLKQKERKKVIIKKGTLLPESVSLADETQLEQDYQAAIEKLEYLKKK